MREQLYLKQLNVLHRVLKNVRKKHQGDASNKNQELIDDLNRVALEVHTLREDLERFIDAEESPLHKNLENWK